MKLRNLKKNGDQTELMGMVHMWLENNIHTLLPEENLRRSFTSKNRSLTIRQPMSMLVGNNQQKIVANKLLKVAENLARSNRQDRRKQFVKNLKVVMDGADPQIKKNRLHKLIKGDLDYFMP